jgi:hypothetical protein
MNENWVKTYCSEEHLVSDKGRVMFSSSKTIIEPYICDRGYKRTKINGKNIRIHQLVYYSFNGGSPSGMKYVIDHIDGNKFNNNLENLQLISQAENVNKRENIVHNLPNYISAFPYHRDRNRLMYVYRRRINGKTVKLKGSLSLQDILKFKEEYERKK